MSQTKCRRFLTGRSTTDWRNFEHTHTHARKHI